MDPMRTRRFEAPKPPTKRGKRGKEKKGKDEREKKTTKMSNAVPNAGKEINVGSSQG